MQICAQFSDFFVILQCCACGGGRIPGLGGKGPATKHSAGSVKGFSTPATRPQRDNAKHRYPTDNIREEQNHEDRKHHKMV